MAAKEDVYRTILVLKEFGPTLGRPFVDSVHGNRHKNLKELRVQSRGRPLRVFFAFDSRRTGVLLLGGNKAGAKRFYEQSISLAEKLFDQYLECYE